MHWSMDINWFSFEWNRVVSPIDGRSLTGISSIRVMQPRDYKGQGRRVLRWTELFLLHTDESGRKTVAEDSSCDVTRFAETIAKAAAMALAVKLDSLDPHTLVGLRFTLDGDTVISISFSNLFTSILNWLWNFVFHFKLDYKIELNCWT